MFTSTAVDIGILCTPPTGCAAGILVRVAVMVLVVGRRCTLVTTGLTAGMATERGTGSVGRDTAIVVRGTTWDILVEEGWWMYLGLHEFKIP